MQDPHHTAQNDAEQLQRAGRVQHGTALLAQEILQRGTRDDAVVVGHGGGEVDEQAAQDGEREGRREQQQDDGFDRGDGCCAGRVAEADGVADDQHVGEEDDG